jgi:hypothetical protein
MVLDNGDSQILGFVSVSVVETDEGEGPSIAGDRQVDRIGVRVHVLELRDHAGARGIPDGYVIGIFVGEY